MTKIIKRLGSLYFFFISSSLFAQNIGYHAPQRVFVTDAQTQQVAHVTIFNHNPNSLSVLVKRVVNNLDSAHVSYFCWGPTCYGPFANVALQSDTILSNDSNSTFKGYVDANGADGESHVSYCFYDENQPNDSVCLNFTHHFGALGLDEAFNRVFVSEPYPNPANRFITFSYSLPQGHKTYLVRLYDMLGQLVHEQVLQEKIGTLLLPLEGLKAGNYQCSFYADGKFLLGRKCILLPK